MRLLPHKSMHWKCVPSWDTFWPSFLACVYTTQAIFLLQFPIDVDYTTGFGFFTHVADLDTLDYIVQDLRCQFLDISIIRKMGIDFSSLHRGRKRAHLLQHIRVKHIVINPVRLRANIRPVIMMHTEVHICWPT